MYEPVVASNQTQVKEEHDLDEGRARCPAGLRSAGKLLASLIHQAVAWLGTVVAAERERGIGPFALSAAAPVSRSRGRTPQGVRAVRKFIRQADAVSRHFE